MQSMKTVVLSCVSAAWVMVVAPAEAAETAVLGPAPQGEASFSDLTMQAESHRAAGRYAESAQAFAAAYESLSEREQRGLKGEITIGNAVDDYRLAQRAKPESIGLLFQEIALLERYRKRMGELPEELAKELGRAKARVEDLHRAEEERKAKGREAEAAAKAEQSDPAEASTPTSEPQPAAAIEAPSRRGADWAIVGSGAVALVGGVGLMGAGGWMFGAADERRDEQLAALESDVYPDEASIRDDLAQWHQRGRGLATGLVVSGAVLAGVGIGLTT
jgi:hypothetical protein